MDSMAPVDYGALSLDPLGIVPAVAKDLGLVEKLDQRPASRQDF